VSRIGKQPIPVPDGVEVTIEPELVRVKGPKGELQERVAREIGVEERGGDGEAGGAGQIVVSRPTDRGEHRALHGLTRSLIFNMVQGVTEGYEKRLEIQGVGYRAQLQGTKLVLALGYSHPVEIETPDGIDFEVPQPTQIVVRGISKQLVGEVASGIRKKRPPEPYKGKGIRYQGEYVARKVGKRA
jgi:large subunit ribosomal protein L6